MLRASLIRINFFSDTRHLPVLVLIREKSRDRRWRSARPADPFSASHTAWAGPKEITPLTMVKRGGSSRNYENFKLTLLDSDSESLVQTVLLWISSSYCLTLTFWLWHSLTLTHWLWLTLALIIWLWLSNSDFMTLTHWLWLSNSDLMTLTFWLLFSDSDSLTGNLCLWNFAIIYHCHT